MHISIMNYLLALFVSISLSSCTPFLLRPSAAQRGEGEEASTRNDGLEELRVEEETGVMSESANYLP